MRIATLPPRPHGGAPMRWPTARSGGGRVLAHVSPASFPSLLALPSLSLRSLLLLALQPYPPHIEPPHSRPDPALREKRQTHQRTAQPHNRRPRPGFCAATRASTPPPRTTACTVNSFKKDSRCTLRVYTPRLYISSNPCDSTCWPLP